MTGMGSHQKHGNAHKVWLTPPHIIEELGPFDLDLCFGDPRPWDTAKKHYGPDVDGLQQPWEGMVWCNPPYDSEAFLWLEKCAQHGNAIALVFARTEVKQFHRQVWEKATGLLFLEGRLFFHRPDGERAAHNGGAPSVLVAYGDEAFWRLINSTIKGRLIEL